LHEASMIEIIDISKEDPSILEEAEKADMHPEAAACTNYELRLTRLIDILRKIQKSPSGIKALLHPQLPEIKSIEESSLDELYSYTESLLQLIEQNILVYEKQINELGEQKEKIESNIEQVLYLKDFALDVSDVGESAYVFTVAGKTSELPSIEKETETLDAAALYSKQFGKGKKREWAVIIAVHISEKEKIERICRERITLFDLENLSGAPKEVIKTLEDEKTKIKNEKKQILTKLRGYASKNLHDLLATREEIRIERIRKEVSRDFAKTRSTYLIKGWVLETNEDELKSLISAVSNDYAIYASETPSINPDNPPIYLETPGWAKSFRMFLEMFATPKYNEIDPVIFMGIFFVLFFGIMLGDAGYGLVIIFLSLYGFIRFSKYSETIKNWSFMGIWLGLTTTVVGFLTNSFFGDLIPRFLFHNPDQKLYSLTLGGIQLPVESLRDPLTLLVIALIFGLIHLNLGILLAIYQSYKNKDFKSLITKHFSWVPLQVGGALLIGSFLLHMWTLGELEFYASIALMAIGLILRFIDAGPLGFFDITGYIGDWLSYARLLALGLATTGMALAFNIVGEIIPQMIPVVGIVLVPIILVFAHTINLGLQTLGAGVHSLRLQYVEFFNRFYEGGGEKFKPFSIKRKYTKIKETK
ncbi:MAG: V-type ATP synthase subunit I, partial [Thermoplasmatales archaeon]